MISQTADYALRAMIFLAARNSTATGHEIAYSTQLPPDYLSKILKSLGRAKLIKAKRGAGGGFILAKEAGEISLLDIINAVAPIEHIKTCPLGIKSHGPELCPLHKRLSQAVLNAKAYFAQSDLRELSEESKGTACTRSHNLRPSQQEGPATLHS